MTNKQFRDWRKRTKLSLSGAATALGMARSMIAEYQKDRPIPRVVALACWAIDHAALDDLPATDKGRTLAER